MILNCRKIKVLLDKLQIEGLALTSGFYQRKPRKITATDLMLSFFKMTITGNFSYRIWASHIASLIDDTVSFQAISKKLDIDNSNFFEEVFYKILSSKMNQDIGIQTNELFDPFNRVLLEDSTCFKLQDELAEHFPGPTLPHGRKATGRVQLRFQLKHNTIESAHVTDYCKHDKTYANNVVDSLQPDDLVIRDLGYWRIDTFRQIEANNGYFLTRIPTSINLYKPCDDQQLDLVKYLKQQAQKGVRQIDINLEIGRKEKLPIRFVANKLTADQAKKRMAMNKANRHKKNKMSDQAKYLTKWNLFVTNVDDQVWSSDEIYAVYNLRWHIETIFKCWKSKFKFAEFFKHCKKENPVKPRIIVMLILIWLALFYQRLYNTYASKVWRIHKKLLSPLKFADFLKEHFHQIQVKSEDHILAWLAYYCTYDKRSDRKNHLEKIIFSP